MAEWEHNCFRNMQPCQFYRCSLLFIVAVSLFSSSSAAAFAASNPPPKYRSPPRGENGGSKEKVNGEKSLRERPSWWRGFDYDLVVIGGGASGLFAAGTAASIGCRTLLIDRATEVDGEGEGSTNAEFAVGGDCTNAACVPSKAVRSAARLALRNRRSLHVVAPDHAPDGANAGGEGRRWLRLARSHADAAVSAVRSRESPSRIGSGPYLDLQFVSDCRFVSTHGLNVTAYDEDGRLKTRPADGVGGEETRLAGSRVVTARRFLIATGASPVAPRNLTEAADKCGVPWGTYRTVLRPKAAATGGGGGAAVGGEDAIWSLLDNSGGGVDDGTAGTAGMAEPTRTTMRRRRKPQVIVAGGGATACELSQSLSRLGGADWDVTVVAPDVLPSEDVTLRRAAIKLLTDDGVRIILGRRIVNVIREEDGAVYDGNGGENNAKVVLDDGSRLPTSFLLLCLGRSPDSSLSSLNLTATGATWTPSRGVDVNSYLRSKAVRHVYACGDCASAIPARDRRAAHAGWTGFHAVRNAVLPLALGLLRSPAVHGHVPRVVYTDPELAATGLTEAECAAQFGDGGYASLYVPERGTDRADVEGTERSPDVGFVSLRASRLGGRVLGGTVAGPAAAELINELSLCTSAGLTVRDLARAVHSYPSHGYLLYRVALAVATSSMSGLLAGCGLVGRALAAALRAAERAAVAAAKVTRLVLSPGIGWRRQRRRAWEAEGCCSAVVLGGRGVVKDESEGGPDIVLTEGFGQGGESMLSFLKIHKNRTLRTSILSGDSKEGMEAVLGRDDFVRWCSIEPQ